MTITDEQLQLLFEKALEASKHAYIPYSHFPVGAALLTEDGNIITGANIENRSFGLTNCAERSAIFTAASQGVRTFIAIAIATPASDYPVGPCGACRQRIRSGRYACRIRSRPEELRENDARRAVSLRQFTRTCIERRRSLKSAVSAPNECKTMPFLRKKCKY